MPGPSPPLTLTGWWEAQWHVLLFHLVEIVTFRRRRNADCVLSWCVGLLLWFCPLHFSHTAACFWKQSSAPVCHDTVVNDGKECGTNWEWKSLRFPDVLCDLYIRCNILYYLSRSFGNWCSSVTVVTRQPENLLQFQAGAEICVFATASSLSLWSTHPPVERVVEALSQESFHPPTERTLEALCLGPIHPPVDGHWKLSVWGGWALETLCLGSIHPPLDEHWKLCLGPIHPPLDEHWTLCLGPIHPPLDEHWKLCLGPIHPPLDEHWKLCLGPIHPPLDGHWELSVWDGWALEALCLGSIHPPMEWRLKLLGVHLPTFGWALEALCGRSKWGVKLTSHVLLLPKVKKEWPCGSTLRYAVLVYYLVNQALGQFQFYLLVHSTDIRHLWTFAHVVGAVHVFQYWPLVCFLCNLRDIKWFYSV